MMGKRRVVIGMDDKRKANGLSSQIIAAAIQVHRNLGPGLIELGV